MRHLQSSPSEAIASIQRSDQIGPFVSKTLRKASITSPALVHVRLPIAGEPHNRLSSDRFILSTTLSYKGRKSLIFFCHVFTGNIHIVISSRHITSYHHV